MWIKDQPAPTPEHFDEHYRGLSSVITPDIEKRVQQSLDLIGPTAGKRILDLGGGGLLCRYVKDADLFVQVDYSQEACNLTRSIAPWCTIRNMDVMEYLTLPTMHFDIAIASGVVEYLPEHGLWRLFRLAPSNVLVLGVSAAEAYLKYPARITIPSRDDVMNLAKTHKWTMVKEIPMPSHVWARFERNK